MTTDRTQLRALATAATPGPWEYIPTAPNRGVDFVRTELGPTVCDFGGYPPTRADAAFIAAANPTAVLALLDEIERLRESERQARALTAAERLDHISTLGQAGELSKQLAAMTAARDELVGIAQQSTHCLFDGELRGRRFVRIDELSKVGSP